MPRSRKKRSIMNFFLLTQNFILTILSPSKSTCIKKNSWLTLVINERDLWPVSEEEMTAGGVRVLAAITATLYLTAFDFYSLSYNIREPLQSKRQNVSGLFLRLCTD